MGYVQAFSDLACAAADDTACGWLTRRIGDETVSRVLAYALGTPLFVVAAVVAAILIRWIARRAIRRAVDRVVTRPSAPGGRFDLLDRADPQAVLRRAQRARAIGSLLSAVVTVAVWALAVLVILPEVGVEIAGLVAGAGVVGIALAFGTQTFVADLVSGIFMIAEDQYGVGDVVDMGPATGVVEAVGLRTTRLRAVDGTVWHVRNGQVTRVANMSQGWSRALVDIEVADDSHVGAILDMVRGVGQSLRNDPTLAAVISEDPDVALVAAPGADSVVIRLTIPTSPLQQWTVAREARARIRAGLESPSDGGPAHAREIRVRTEGPGSAQGPTVAPWSADAHPAGTAMPPHG